MVHRVIADASGAAAGAWPEVIEEKTTNRSTTALQRAEEGRYLHMMFTLNLTVIGVYTLRPSSGPGRIRQSPAWWIRRHQLGLNEGFARVGKISLGK